MQKFMIMTRAYGIENALSAAAAAAAAADNGQAKVVELLLKRADQTGISPILLEEIPLELAQAKNHQDCV